MLTIQNLLVEDATLPPALPYMTPYTVSGQASGSSPTFSPLDLPGLQLWLRGDLGITIATGVSVWADQSGSGNNVVQASGSLQPAYNTVTINGQLCVVGNGTNQYLQSGSSAFNTGALTVLFVAQQTVGGSTHVPLSFQISGHNIWGCVFNGAASNFLIDSLVLPTGTTDAFSEFIEVLGNFNLGDYWPGPVAEVIVYKRALVATELATLHAYLSARYAIPLI